MSTTRKQLLALSKTALIKECKKYKVATTGSKSDMVDRILKKCKPQQTSKPDTKKNVNKTNTGKSKSKSKSKSRSNLPFQTATTYLITSYIRRKLLNKTARNNRYEYDSVSMIIIEYVGSVFLKFDLCHDKYKKCIKGNGFLFSRDLIRYEMSSEEHQQYSNRKIFKGKRAKKILVHIGTNQPCIFAVGSKCGLIGKKRIYKWKIRLKTDNEHIRDLIGITDNVSLFDMEVIQRTNKATKLIKKHITPYCIDTLSSGLTRTKSREVDITLDFRTKWITYKFDAGARKESVRHHVEHDKMYYLVILSFCDGTEYELTVDLD